MSFFRSWCLVCCRSYLNCGAPRWKNGDYAGICLLVGLKVKSSVSPAFHLYDVSDRKSSWTSHIFSPRIVRNLKKNVKLVHTRYNVGRFIMLFMTSLAFLLVASFFNSWYNFGVLCAHLYRGENKLFISFVWYGDHTYHVLVPGTRYLYRAAVPTAVRKG